MSEGTAMKMATSTVCEPSTRQTSQLPVSEVDRSRHIVFWTLWYASSALFVLSILLAMYSGVWEYSTRRYLKGFSDAIIPEEAAPEQKVEAIVNWMAHGPERQQELLPQNGPDRDPTDTLNYASLLQVCGTATNAFVNLADSAGIPARRLLLLNSQRMAKHVVAEAWINGRWIVVDPAFRTILHGANGALLTRDELTNPLVFAAATRNIRGYDPTYTFDRTAHLRASRLPVIGSFGRRALSAVVPSWDESAFLSLLLERKSLEALAAALVLVFFFGMLRLGLRWYGERRFGVRATRIRHQVRRAIAALLDTAG